MTESLFTAPDATWLAGGHRRAGKFGGTDVWLTPPHVLHALGPFDLDPCAAPNPRPWPTAGEHYTLPEQDGLRLPWHGRVWVNPPYTSIGPWLAKLADPGTGTALIFARTETAAFHRFVWGRATAALFLRGRITFHRPDGQPGKGNAGAPSVLVAYGEHDAAQLVRALHHPTIDGHMVCLSRSKSPAS